MRTQRLSFYTYSTPKKDEKGYNQPGREGFYCYKLGNPIKQVLILE